MSDDQHRRQLVAELKKHPGYDAWKGWAKEIRDAYFTNLGQALYNGTPITAEDLAFKRGYFKAMARMFNEIDFSAKAVHKDLDEVNGLE